MTDTDAPENSGLDPDANDVSDPSSAAASQQTVVNDAVAGETVTDGAGAVPTAAPASPTSDELRPANDGYLAPRNETSEEIDLDDSDGAASPVTSSHVERTSHDGDPE